MSFNIEYKQTSFLSLVSLALLNSRIAQTISLFDQGIGGNGFPSQFSKSCSSAFNFCLSISNVDLANFLSDFTILTGCIFWKWASSSEISRWASWIWPSMWLRSVMFCMTLSLLSSMRFFFSLGENRWCHVLDLRNTSFCSSMLSRRAHRWLIRLNGLCKESYCCKNSVSWSSTGIPKIDTY